MHIHTNHPTPLNMIQDAIETVPGVAVHTISAHRSRSRNARIDVRLTGTGGRNNTGLYGAGDYNGATWDEWGAFLGAVFAADPHATVPGVYQSAEHFHWVTGGRFAAAGMPANTHKRHGWRHEGTNATGAYTVRRCRTCDAIERRATSADYLATILAPTPA